MSKRLPYFQFEPAEWLAGDIMFCTLQAQGLFTTLKALYWQKDCDLLLEQAIKRLKNDDLFDELISEKIIKIKSGKIRINFLDEQWEKLSEKSKINSKNGALGGRPKKQIETQNKPNGFNSLSKNESETKALRREEIREEESKIREEESNSKEFVDLKNQPISAKIDFDKLISFFNSNRGVLPEVKKMSDARKKRILVLEKIHGKESIQTVITKMRDSQFLQGNNKDNWIASFDWIFKPANFIKILEDNYANREIPKTSSGNQPKKQQFVFSAQSVIDKATASSIE